MSGNTNKMGFNATWSMAVGGMVGGGIFSVLGVVVEVAAQWAWLSFLTAGLLTLASAYSYSALSTKFKESGGAFLFLRKINQEGLAGSLAWVLILGYVLTISVYAFTFGHYVAHVTGMGAWLPRLLAVAIIAVLSLVNLRGVGDSSNVEIVTVWGKLFVLIGLAAFGMYMWAPEKLTEGVDSQPIYRAFIGAGVIFMAYEGFQLLTYDYADIRNPGRILPKASMIAVLSVIVIYIAVSLGATMLTGAQTIIEQKETALAVAGKQALGTTGLVLVTIAAAFSTASAINATLFSTSRLMEDVAKQKDLPDLVARENKENVPFVAVLTIGGIAGFLSAIGSLGMLVESASLVFLFTFGTVNWIAFREKLRYRWISLAGMIGIGCAIIIAVWRLIHKAPLALGILTVFVIIALVGRPYILKKIHQDNQ